MKNKVVKLLNNVMLYFMLIISVLNFNYKIYVFKFLRII